VVIPKYSDVSVGKPDESVCFNIRFSLKVGCAASLLDCFKMLVLAGLLHAEL
jgi:hypothetical protein